MHEFKYQYYSERLFAVMNGYSVNNSTPTVDIILYFYFLKSKSPMSVVTNMTLNSNLAISYMSSGTLTHLLLRINTV